MKEKNAKQIDAIGKKLDKLVKEQDECETRMKEIGKLLVKYMIDIECLKDKPNMLSIETWGTEEQKQMVA